MAALTGAERSERQSRYQPRFRYDGVTTFHFDRGYTANSDTCISSRVALAPLPQVTP